MNRAIVIECKKYRRDETQKHIGVVVDILARGNGSYICKCNDNILSFSEDELERLIMFGPPQRIDTRLTVEDIKLAHKNQTNVWLAYTDETHKICYSIRVASIRKPIIGSYITAICLIIDGRSRGATVNIRVSNETEFNDPNYSIYFEKQEGYKVQ